MPSAYLAMKPFTDPPLTVGTLSQRLKRYGFWERPTLDVPVARNALLAAKFVARPPANKPIPRAVEKIVPSSADPHQLLDRMYNHEPVRQRMSDIWHEMLIVEPAPPSDLKLDILQRVLETKTKVSRDEAMKALTAVLRSEVSRANFIEGVALLNFVPQKSLLSVLALPVTCLVLATSSFALWVPSYIVGAGLFAFWSGLAFNFFRDPVYPRACWSTYAQTGRFSRLRRLDQLRLANFVLSAFEETESLNLRNYHLHEFHTQNDANATLTEKNIITALRKLGISFKGADPVVSMYADYWSDQNLRWDSVEWKEPDQDPANIIYYQARKLNVTGRNRSTNS